MKGEKVQNVGVIVNQSIEIGDREVIVYDGVSLLLNYGANVNMNGSLGISHAMQAICRACWDGKGGANSLNVPHAWYVRWLAATTSKDKSDLHKTYLKNIKEITGLLIAHGADVNMVFDDVISKETPSDTAILSGNEEAFSVLLAHRATVATQAMEKYKHMKDPAKARNFIIDHEEAYNCQVLRPKKKEFQFVGNGLSVQINDFHSSGYYQYYFIEPEEELGHPNYFIVKNQDFIYLLLAGGMVRLAFEVVGSSSSRIMPPFYRFVIVKRRDDLHLTGE